VFLGNVFSLAGAATGQLDAAYFPEARYGAVRATLSPGVTFAQASRRGNFSLNYAPSFTRTLYESTPLVNGAPSLTLVHRLAMNFGRALTPNTSVSASVTGVTGNFDLAGLTSQLGSPNGVGVAATNVATPTPIDSQGAAPGGVATGTGTTGAGTTGAGTTGAGTNTGAVTPGAPTTVPGQTGAALTQGTTSYRNLTAALGVATALSPRWRINAGADGSYAQSNQAAVLGGVPQTQLGVATGLAYALSPHMALQGTAIGRYTYARVGRGPLLQAGGTLGTGIQLSRTTRFSVNAGYVYSGPWFGVERIDATNSSGFMAGGSFSQVLSEGNNAFSYSVGAAWQPTYDPIAARVVGRANLNAGLTWLPARDWDVGLNASLLTSTTSKPQTPEEPADDLGAPVPLPETRVSAALPVSYAMAHWATLIFGANAFFSAPHLAAPFQVMFPSYSAYVGVQVRVP